jgi:hypothetical protein
MDMDVCGERGAGGRNGLRRASARLRADGGCERTCQQQQEAEEKGEDEHGQGDGVAAAGGGFGATLVGDGGGGMAGLLDPAAVLTLLAHAVGCGGGAGSSGVRLHPYESPLHWERFGVRWAQPPADSSALDGG